MSQQEINKIIIDYLMPYEPVKMFFGSFADRKKRPKAILIFLLIQEKYFVIDLVQIYQDLEEKLGRKVDIVTERFNKKSAF